ncbi:MAG: DNA topoisomerase IV subunit A [Thermoguttaceae bacterium]|nr:DNA topoisomerase IV subunit A [Thermoguttaceae bacterium]
MAKARKKTTPSQNGAYFFEDETGPVALSAQDERTLTKIYELAAMITARVDRNEEPVLAIPARSLGNVSFNEEKRVLQMGDKTTSRELFNLSQAKSFMQTTLVASGTKRLIEMGKTTSIRGLYYMLKHDVRATKEPTFHDQGECDPVIEDCEVLLAALREELHLFADKRGDMVGNITIVDSGDEIDCSRMGSGGYAIPSIVEPSVIQFKECKADFVLHVEKNTVWQRFNEDKFWKKHNCILTHGNGQPPRGVRRLLNRLNTELGLPVYCLLDNDPWGYYIYSVVKQGSINLAYESERMATPSAKFIGVRSRDFERCGLSEGVKISLNDIDRKRAKQIAEYPWFAHKKDWRREIDMMLDNGFKLEVEALVSRSISYMTEEYVPRLLREGDFLD